MTLPTHPFRPSYRPADDRIHDFYLPALERTVRYRRSAGYFSSSALAIAAAGVARLVENGGTMQLLCGADLSREDVDAVLRGESLKGRVERAMLRGLDQEGESAAGESDDAAEARLEILAWLVANERLDIRVVLPRGPDGRPISTPESQQYYHPKKAVFDDADGNRLAFSGSSNESRRGWLDNYETFHVFASWQRRIGPDLIPAEPHHIEPVERHFRDLWQARDPNWIALELPQAVRQQLVKQAPTKPPTVDPLENPRDGDRAVFRFLRDAPFMPGSSRIGIDTSAVEPWPHQNRVIDAVVERFPDSFLFCDEVGLGKTIEAGLALRQLIVTGRVRRSLVLAPASVVRQWQEELWEKCALDIPRYERGALFDARGRERPIDGPPWAKADHLIASSQLAKRTDRRDQVLEAEWDLVLVDEAHHARRKNFGAGAAQPNHLLQLLGGRGERPGLKDRARCLYLLTATPMQVHPVEVWDLLKLLGLEGRWGASDDNFIRFFEEVRSPFALRDWGFLLGMTKDQLDVGGGLDPAFAEAARAKLGPVAWNTVRSLPGTIKARAAVAGLDANARSILDGMVRRHTPIRTFVWRNGRDLLHRYRKRGILKEKVPMREPANEWIEFTPEEQDLYERIENYISHFYRKYEEQRPGLGFVMTVYRRRLTSSFHAARKSLQRRREALLADEPAAAFQTMTAEDMEQDDLGADAGEKLELPKPDARAAELAYLDDFISDLTALSADSKLEFLKRQLAKILLSRDSAILFTQYTDTMDHLRESLRPVYGAGVACYSGRGGESWDGERWVVRRKEEIKDEFRAGRIKVFLCTESASEGLNLQTCGVLINYDMPWNPMRVEQRIGRIDRIGQCHDVVAVKNYFFRDTVEARVYERLSDRIDWFEHVVGNLQPILHKVGGTIAKLAMMGRDGRDEALDDALSKIEAQVDAQDQAAIDLDALVDDAIADSEPAPGPVSLGDIERAFLTSGLTRERFTPHANISGAHWLATGGEPGKEPRAVTFRREVFDRHPSTVELLTYGNPTFDDLLSEAAGPLAENSDSPADDADAAAPVADSIAHSAHEAGAAMLLRDGGNPPVAVCVVKEPEGIAQAAGMAAYRRAAEKREEKWSQADRRRARAMLKHAREDMDARSAVAREERRAAMRRGLREQARQVLFQGAHVLAVRKGLLAADGRDPVDRLCQEGVPYLGLRSILKGDAPAVSPSDPYRAELETKKPAVLTRLMGRIRVQGMEVLRQYAELQ